jgi:4-amino-4-deoxy-L-arabinose transferase-like glycosyltransferase
LGKVSGFAIDVWSNVRSFESRLAVHADAVCVLSVVAFSALLFFINLRSGPLWAADERTYSQWGFYMAKTGDYLNPWAFGVPALWIGKPPLYFWLMALAYQIFGVSNFSTRFWSPIFGVLSCVVVFYLGKELYNRAVGLLAVVVLGTFFSFFAFARHAMLDVPLIFFMLASIFFFVLSEKLGKSNRFAMLGGLSFGLALMTKQTNALLIPLILGFYVTLTQRSIKSLFTKRFALFLAVGILVICPWLIYMALQFGPDFWRVYLVYNNVARAVVPLEGHAGDFLFYLNFLVTRENLLWIAVLTFATALSVFNSFRKRSRADTLLVVPPPPVLGVFTVAQTKLYWYILPAFPTFALVISNFLYSLYKKRNFWRKNR